jgi:tripartite-type tricarboxylate transporter receptor subunit TctC
VKLWAALLLAWLSIAAGTAWAQGYPRPPIRLIVPFGPGSGSGIAARRLGLYLQDRWKQPVVIDNRPGAQGLIGTQALKNAPSSPGFPHRAASRRRSSPDSIARCRRRRTTRSSNCRWRAWG